jgi:glycosyltransferase involved in cell wall biosynthesis
VDPLDIQALSAAIIRVLTSPDLARELRQRGLTQAATFTWERTAMQTHAIYEEVMSVAVRNKR